MSPSVRRGGVESPTAGTCPTPRGRASFRRRLRAWYARNARDLPWRRTGGDPYAIWLSEVMLQQTQAATVTAYFERFLIALPNVEALAAARVEKVLRLWEGLGYYRRARQLHQAARLIVERHGGRFPRDVNELRRLPGVGRYTAGAIASIAFDQPAPILEANTIRLFSRLLAYRGQPDSAAGQRLGWAMAEAVLPRRRPGQFNSALMELGSEVCRPREPALRRLPRRDALRRPWRRLASTDSAAEAEARYENGSRSGGGGSPRRAGALDSASRRRALGWTLGFPSLSPRRPQ